MDLLEIAQKIRRNLKGIPLDDARRALSLAGEAVERDAAAGGDAAIGSAIANGASAPAN